MLILVPNPTSVWSNDTDNRYRPNSDVLYLTGFSEAEAILLLSKLDQDNSLLGVLPRNPERETWTGKLFGPEAAK
ncbi:MAG TPA: aminopeptidase P N-terminal domain-containing protein, partial [Candidatus Hodarchaeales archaeon]|nr:aminopeptidase P N-terminal domain-containing protein [Candidatus Hodarchaeales archaeon]